MSEVAPQFASDLRYKRKLTHTFASLRTASLCVEKFRLFPANMRRFSTQLADKFTRKIARIKLSRRKLILHALIVWNLLNKWWCNFYYWRALRTYIYMIWHEMLFESINLFENRECLIDCPVKLFRPFMLYSYAS